MKVESCITQLLDSCYQDIPLDEQFPDLPEDLNNLSHIRSLNEWNFTSLDLNRTELLQCVWFIFDNHFDLLDKCDIDRTIFTQFLLAIHANYFDNPYHNFFHAIDVLQCCYYLIKFESTIMLTLLDPFDLFALLLACLTHDLGHPSFGNSFLKETCSPLAILFNDHSVLENFHSMLLFAILRNPRYDFTRSWNNRNCVKRFRRIVLSCILATDMSTHFGFVEAFEKDFPSLYSEPPSLLSETNKLQLCMALIKCSDISNVIRPFHIAVKWGVSLLNEFLLQGDYERVLDLPIGPLNDRKSIATGAGQNSFLTVIAAPLYNAVSKKIPGTVEFC